MGQVARAPGQHGFHVFVPAPLPREVPLTAETILLLSEADDALGRLAGAGRLLPNPHLLVNAYLTREAVASSRIEGTQASLSEVFQAVAGRATPPASDIREVENYIRAMELGLQRLAELPICLRLVREMHGVLMRGVRGRERQPGLFRREQNWIGSTGDRPETAAFVPPPVDAMGNALKDWEQYINDAPRTPLLVQCAMLHYQFETIHPFLDGNGRLGRLVVVLFLVERGRLPQPLLYISRYLEDNRSEYYQRLQAVRETGDIQAWLQFFLRAVEVQARDAVQRAERLVDVRERYRQALRGSRSRAPEVVDLLLSNPVITTKRIQAALGVTNAGALNIVARLEDHDILHPAGVFGRGGRRYWVAREVLDVLEEDEVDAGQSGEPEQVTSSAEGPT